MIIHEVGKYYDKKEYDEILKGLNKTFSFKDISDLKRQIDSDSNLKDNVKMNLTSYLTNNEMLHLNTKSRNSAIKLAQDLGLDKEMLNSKEEPAYSRKEIKEIIKRNDEKEIKKAMDRSRGTYLWSNSKQDFFNSRRLTNIHTRNINGKDKRKEEVMKQWEDRKQRLKEKHAAQTAQKKTRLLKRAGIGTAIGGGTYLIARKLAKLKGLENKYARKLLLLPPNKRNFVQKMLDKIRALIRKYKH